MSDRQARNGEAGFTLVEVLVAMTLALLLGGLALVVLVQTIRGANAWQRRVHAVNAEHRVLRTLSADLRSSSAVWTEAGAASLVAGSDTTTYRLDQGSLRRNGQIVGRGVVYRSLFMGQDVRNGVVLFTAHLATTEDTLSLFVAPRLRPHWVPLDPVNVH